MPLPLYINAPYDPLRSNYSLVNTLVLELSRQSLAGGSDGAGRGGAAADDARVAWAGAHAGILDGLAAARVVVRGGLVQVAVVDGGVDGDGDPREHAVGNVLGQLDVLDKGVVVGGGLLEHPAVLLGRRVGDRVERVRRRGLDLLDEGVVKVQLADMLGHAADVGPVLELRDVGLRDEVEVGDAVRVVTRED